MQPSSPRSSSPRDGRFAAIDCGTNSVKLLVADLSAGVATPVLELSETTRIGEGMHVNNMLLQERPMERTLDAIERFAHSAEEQGVEAIAAIATAALRDAQNGSQFVERVRARCAVALEIIPGAEEARLSFLAVRRDAHWRRMNRLLVIDIGGGSTELIQGEDRGEGVATRTSVNLGAVKLTERFLRSDPPWASEVDAAGKAAEVAFSAVELVDPGGAPFHVVGVGGTLTNLGAMRLAASVDPEQLHGLPLRRQEIDGLCDLLASRSVEERRQLPGLDPRRADIILGGAILLRQALAFIRGDTVDVSTRGLRWGLLYDRFM